MSSLRWESYTYSHKNDLCRRVDADKDNPFFLKQAKIVFAYQKPTTSATVSNITITE
jgi:hypothetical protein